MSFKHVKISILCFFHVYVHKLGYKVENIPKNFKLFERLQFACEPEPRQIKSRGGQAGTSFIWVLQLASILPSHLYNTFVY